MFMKGRGGDVGSHRHSWSKCLSSYNYSIVLVVRCGWAGWGLVGISKKPYCLEVIVIFIDRLLDQTWFHLLPLEHRTLYDDDEMRMRMRMTMTMTMRMRMMRMMMMMMMMRMRMRMRMRMMRMRMRMTMTMRMRMMMRMMMMMMMMR